VPEKIGRGPVRQGAVEYVESDGKGGIVSNENIKSYGKGRKAVDYSRSRTGYRLSHDIVNNLRDLEEEIIRLKKNNLKPIQVISFSLQSDSRRKEIHFCCKQRTPAYPYGPYGEHPTPRAPGRTNIRNLQVYLQLYSHLNPIKAG